MMRAWFEREVFINQPPVFEQCVALFLCIIELLTVGNPPFQGLSKTNRPQRCFLDYGGKKLDNSGLFPAEYNPWNVRFVDRGGNIFVSIMFYSPLDVSLVIQWKRCENIPTNSMLQIGA
jgi:hypothetical protein